MLIQSGLGLERSIAFGARILIRLTGIDFCGVNLKLEMLAEGLLINKIPITIAAMILRAVCWRKP